MLLLLVAACLGAGAHLAAGYGQQLRLARSDLDEGQRQLKEGHPTEAVRTFQRGLSRARDLPGQGELAGELARLLLVAERAEAAADLHQLAERLRFVCGGDAPPPRSARQLEERCRTAWEGRRFLANRQRAEETVRADLLDLAILWADLGVRLAPPGRDGDARRHALRLLDEAETLLGPHPALRRERRNHSRLLGLPGSAPAGDDRQLPRTAWECTALGRSLLRSGRLEEATGVLERALGLHPQDFWLNFYQGLCTYRLENYHRALAHFHACVVLAPASPECLYNRALTLAALGQPRRALRDYDRALQLNHHFAAAALNRGLLNYQRQHYAAALAGFQKALDSGADPARAHYNLALTYLALGNRAAALAHLERALGQNPGHREARLLRESLLSRK